MASLNAWIVKVNIKENIFMFDETVNIIKIRTD